MTHLWDQASLLTWNGLCRSSLRWDKVRSWVAQSYGCILLCEALANLFSTPEFGRSGWKHRCRYRGIQQGLRPLQQYRHFLSRQMSQKTILCSLQELVALSLRQFYQEQGLSIWQLIGSWTWTKASRGRSLAHTCNAAWNLQIVSCEALRTSWSNGCTWLQRLLASYQL